MVDVSGRYYNIRLDDRAREAFMQEATSFVSFSRGAGTTRTLRQAAISLKKASPQARSAGSTHGSAKNNPRVMVA